MIQEYFKILSRPRISRRTYINWLIFIVAYQVILQLYFAVTPASGFEELDNWLQVFGILLVFSNLIVVVRRLHDQDRTGWWVLLFLLPQNLCARNLLLLRVVVILYWH